ncbi:MAG: hypothetical protein M0017_03705 [Desulfobacteraceae bacterium]|nr:hypothetical protein [Desulfobacteraceae bacterium]
MSRYQTDQEAFWAGGFGDEYLLRNQGEKVVASNLHLFARVLSATSGVASIMELGANVGLNLKALARLLPGVQMEAVEINEKAAASLEQWGGARVHRCSILEFQPEIQSDLVFTKGVLIHIDPEKIPVAYDLLHRASRRYICVIEYYNPSPVAVSYRGHNDRLFKRDFAGDLLDRFENLRLVDYGFVYRRDRNFPQDDVTWFLLEKMG